ncbi:MAG: signal peptidase I [Lachnospiraceae bacterium]|nr:signal peptidase I [Lachnospiraceae bacterium]
MDTEFDFDFDRQEKKSRRYKFIIKLILWVICICIAIFLGWLFTVVALEKTNMVGSSMKPTLSDDDIIIVNRMSYLFSDPERFDVIVFNRSGKEHSYYACRRIYGLPGEKVQVLDGKLYINGVEIEETINVEPMITSGLYEEEVTLDDDEYFVLGDNRNDCEDSRYFNFGNVSREEIIGEAMVRLSPFGIISKLNLKDKDSDDKDKQF